MRNTTLSLITIIGIAAGLLSCNRTNNSRVKHHPLKVANWLLGDWQNVSANGTYTESWVQQNDSMYNGQSYFIIENDTPSRESITIECIGHDVFYKPTVDGQNNNQPVAFKLTFASEKQLVFENRKHDFPQKIVYNLIHTDSMVAWISGTHEGKQDTLYFPMRRGM